MKINSLYTDYLNKIIEVEIDRPKGSSHPKYGFEYKLNYGFVPNTKAPDGEEIDVYVLGVNKSIKKFKGNCIAIIHRRDDNDDKLIIIPEDSQDKDFPKEKIKKLTHFQEKYFKIDIIK